MPGPDFQDTKLGSYEERKLGVVGRFMFLSALPHFCSSDPHEQILDMHAAM
jgi:hypothetical protein